MTTIDLKGWWCVEDNNAETVVHECAGTVQIGEKTFAMIRLPETRECTMALYIGHFAWFAPEDRAAAEAHAAKVVADCLADDAETDDAAATDEAA